MLAGMIGAGVMVAVIVFFSYYKVDTVEVEQYEVWLKGGTQREYFPYFKNISSDRIILNYHIVKESMEK